MNTEKNSLQDPTAHKNEAKSSKKNLSQLAIFGGNPAFDDFLHVGRPNLGDRKDFIAKVNDILDRNWLILNVKFLRMRLSPMATKYSSFRIFSRLIFSSSVPIKGSSNGLSFFLPRSKYPPNTVSFDKKISQTTKQDGISNCPFSQRFYAFAFGK